jgi:regulator of sirC expression with transglutaminase-like and TPR domain
MEALTALDLFITAVKKDDDQINLAQAALYIAKNQYPDLDINKFLTILDTMAAELKLKLPESSYPLKIIQTINNYLFNQLGFVGNTENYYDPRNSFLNDVLNRRMGIPISLSVIYLEIAQRINFPMVGVGMPGHFIIRPDVEDIGIFIDVFNQGEILFPQDCLVRIKEIYQQPIMELPPTALAPVSKKQILIRMLNNLQMVYLDQANFAAAEELNEWLRALD